MEPARILERLIHAGISIRTDASGTNLNVQSEAPLTDEQRAFLRQHKPALLAHLQALEDDPPPLTDDERANIAEALEERAGIYEFDAGMSRQEAEATANGRMAVYRYRLTDRPDTWLTLLSPNCDLDEARAVLTSQFGPGRLLAVIPNSHDTIEQ